MAPTSLEIAVIIYDYYVQGFRFIIVLHETGVITLTGPRCRHYITSHLNLKHKISRPGKGFTTKRFRPNHLMELDVFLHFDNSFGYFVSCNLRIIGFINFLSLYMLMV